MTSKFKGIIAMMNAQIFAPLYAAASLVVASQSKLVTENVIVFATGFVSHRLPVGLLMSHSTSRVNQHVPAIETYVRACNPPYRTLICYGILNLDSSSSLDNVVVTKCSE